MATKSTAQIILASVSPRREQLLRAMGLQFTVVAPAAANELLEGGTPETLAVTNAKNKAAPVADRFSDALVIGADTIVALGDRVFGKPANSDEAAAMLERLAGRPHDVFTGVCLLQRDRGIEVCFCERTRVWMRALTRRQIEEYLSKIDPLDKAGGYAVQEYGDTIIERIEGSLHNVMGLPTERLGMELERLGLAAAAG
jgi:septum formation protein